MKPGVVSNKQGGRVVITRPASDKRLAELAGKKGNKTAAETSEELLLRVKRIERHLGIE